MVKKVDIPSLLDRPSKDMRPAAAVGNLSILSMMLRTGLIHIPKQTLSVTRQSGFHP